MQDASPATYRTPSLAVNRPSRLTRWLSARTLLLGGVMIVTLALFIAPEQDPDFWWHLRIGQWMVDNGRLPSNDIFTFTVPSHVWIDHEYLTEVLMWRIYSGFGLLTLIVLFGLITWAGFWWMYLQVRRQPYVFVGLGLAIGAVAGSPIWGPRAQMITFALSCLELYWIRGYLTGRSRALNYFPLVMVLWANLHGGWVIAFGWLGVALVTELLSWAIDQDNPAHRVHVRRLAIIGIASAVAVAATPHFLNLYPYPFQTQGSEAQQRLIVEWASPNFHEVQLRPFEAMIFLLVIGFALRRPSIYDLLLALLGLGLALQNVRNIALFVAAVTPMVIITYGEWWRELAATHKWTYTIPPRRLFAVTTAIVLVGITGLMTVRVASNLSPAKQQQLDVSSYPVGAADWLAAHPDVGTRMFNQYGYGGYLAYRFYPQKNRQVFIFGEAALMGDPLLNEYADVYYVRSDWKKVLDKYGIDYVVEVRGDPLPNLLATQPDWSLAYEDQYTVIYVREPHNSEASP
ncbi:MAG TPA: hypothetical protein VLK30_04700 [Candidatus Limnocylindrales bacterium]|nr:hypothetical protein [Candidatus Limnocylindrales bacterium]